MIISGEETEMSGIAKQRVGKDFSLPTVLLDDIMARVSRSSVINALRFGAVCRSCNTSQKSDAVIKVINIAPFMSNPILIHHCLPFFTEAVTSGNLEAMYLQGIKWFMTFENLPAAIDSLNGESLVGVDRATYLMAMCIVLSEGDHDRAHTILDRIVGWRSCIPDMLNMGIELIKTLQAMKNGSCAWILSVLTLQPHGFVCTEHGGNLCGGCFSVCHFACTCFTYVGV